MPPRSARGAAQAAQPGRATVDECLAKARVTATDEFRKQASPESARLHLEIDAASCLDPTLTPAAAHLIGAVNADRARLARDVVVGSRTLYNKSCAGAPARAIDQMMVAGWFKPVVRASGSRRQPLHDFRETRRDLAAGRFIQADRCRPGRIWCDGADRPQPVAGLVGRMIAEGEQHR